MWLNNLGPTPLPITVNLRPQSCSRESLVKPRTRVTMQPSLPRDPSLPNILSLYSFSPLCCRPHTSTGSHISPCIQGDTLSSSLTRCWQIGGVCPWGPRCQSIRSGSPVSPHPSSFLPASLGHRDTGGNDKRSHLASGEVLNNLSLLSMPRVYSGSKTQPSLTGTAFHRICFVLVLLSQKNRLWAPQGLRWSSFLLCYS